MDGRFAAGRSYVGKILHVDLSKMKMEPMPLNPDWVTDFIGGKGLGARYFYELQRPRTEPFSPDNHLIFMTGPLTGTIASTMSRVTVITRSPLTGAFVDSYAGGYFPAELKFAGFDGLIIRGETQSPSWLMIRDGKAELHDASSLWGKDSFDTIGAIREELHGSSRDYKIAAIGPAGENLVRFANICFDKHHFAGRGGTGAVMGSKKLKAIAVRGTMGPKALSINQDKDYGELARDIMKRVREDPAEEWAIKYGTPAVLDSSNVHGLLPTRNFQSGVYPLANEINANAMKSKILTRHISTCFSCTIGCRNETEVREGEFRGLQGEGPEYETLAMCGSNVDVGDINSIAKFNQTCSKMGIDTISTGNVIGWAMELCERGILTSKDMNGLNLRFGDVPSYLQMPEIIAYRKGIGGILAEGVKRASERIGRGSDRFAVQAKGLEYPGYDPRGSFGMALAYATSDRGACHQRAFPVASEAFGELNPFTPEHKADIVMREQIMSSVKYSLIACNFCSIDYEMIARLLTTAVQVSCTESDLIRTGKRIWTLTRLINIREGLSRNDDSVAPRMVNDPLPEGPPKGRTLTQVDFDRMLGEYYKLWGWDDNGKPTKRMLEELSLTELQH
jgi:aldehyde:ferredoxin oxidoreductase